LKARRFGEGWKELILSLKKGSKKTFKKTHLKIWNKESKCCTFASALKSRAKVEVEKRLSDCEKKKKKIFKKFCRNAVEYYLCCPAGSCFQERRRRRKELKPKGFDGMKCQFIGIENTVERCLNEEGCRA
jgi:hypothetical protein